MSMVWLRNAAGGRNKCMGWPLQACEMVMLWLQRIKHHEMPHQSLRDLL